MIQAALLAAGSSSRMGSHKMLLELGGQPMVRRAVNELLQAGFSRVIVVVGREPEQIQAALEGLPCEFVLNPDLASQGMERSLRAAVDAVTSSSPDAKGLLFTLTDQVLISKLEYQKLLEMFNREQPLIAASRFADVIAPPHLFSSQLFPVLGLPGHGAKPLIQANLERTVFVDHAPELLFDVDTPEDYAKAQELLR